MDVGNWRGKWKGLEGMNDGKTKVARTGVRERAWMRRKEGRYRERRKVKTTHVKYRS